MPYSTSSEAFAAQAIPSANTEASSISEEIKCIRERLDEMLSGVLDFLDKHPAR